MNRDAVTVERIQLELVFPEVRIFHALPLAVSLQILTSAVLAVVLLQLVPVEAPNGSANREARMGDSAFRESHPGSDAPSAAGVMSPAARHLGWLFPRWITHFFSSVEQCLPGRTGRRPGACLNLMLQAAVHALAGVSISFVAARRYCLHQPTGIRMAVRQTLRCIPSWAIATGLAGSLTGAAVLGWQISVWLIRVTGIGLHWPAGAAALLWGTAATLIVLIATIGAGWLLSLAATGAESCHATDALSRGISYVLSHSLMAVRCGLLLMAMVIVAGLLTQILSSGAVVLSMDVLESQTAGRPDGLSGEIHRISAMAVQVVQLAVFYCGLTLIYLILRQKEDAVSLTELGDLQSTDTVQQRIPGHGQAGSLM